MTGAWVLVAYSFLPSKKKMKSKLRFCGKRTSEGRVWRQLPESSVLRSRRRLGGGESGGGSGGDKYIYRAVAILAKMAYRLSVQCSKAIRRVMPL